MAAERGLPAWAVAAPIWREVLLLPQAAGPAGATAGAERRAWAAAAQMAWAAVTAPDRAERRRQREPLRLLEKEQVSAAAVLTAALHWV